MLKVRRCDVTRFRHADFDLRVRPKVYCIAAVINSVEQKTRIRFRVTPQVTNRGDKIIACKIVLAILKALGNNCFSPPFAETEGRSQMKLKGFVGRWKLRLQ